MHKPKVKNYNKDDRFCDVLQSAVDQVPKYRMKNLLCVFKVKLAREGI